MKELESKYYATLKERLWREVDEKLYQYDKSLETKRWWNELKYGFESAADAVALAAYLHMPGGYFNILGNPPQGNVVVRAH